MRIAGPVGSDEEAHDVLSVLRTSYAADAARRAARRAGV